MSAILELDGLSKSFGALKVTDEVSLRVDDRETLGILGPNGAGKTTLFNLVTGDVRSDAGAIRFAGTDLTALPPHRRCRAGIGRSYQIPRPFGAMSVFENLLVAARFGAGASRDEATELCGDILRETGLLDRANRPAGSLPLLDRKRLELARALATRPRLLLLDEIAGGLTEHEARLLVDEIASIKARGVTMIWIEHVVHALVAVADRLVVLNFGRIIADGPPRAVLADPAVQRVYMGIES
jgi:branched-chain amino acid transport system ATP-binding protein